MTCSPSNPFGCVHSWGPPVNVYAHGPGVIGDMGQHVCNKASNHVGGHECACGALARSTDA